MSQQVSFTKLDDGSWGVRVYGHPTTPPPVDVDGKIEVYKRDGSVQRVKLGGLVDQWNGGRTKVYSVQRDTPAGSSSNGHGPRKITVTEPGVYKTDDGLFRVQANQAGNRLYAKRVTASGKWEYDRGAIFGLTPADLVDDDKVDELFDAAVDAANDALEAEEAAQAPAPQAPRPDPEADEIAQMPLEKVERGIAAIAADPPTMDYMVEYGRTMRRLGLLQARKEELAGEVSA